MRWVIDPLDGTASYVRGYPGSSVSIGIEVDGRPAVVMSYDYMVLAGTQGMRNHLKKDRLFEVAERRRLPVVLFAEGGGGRPDMAQAGGPDGSKADAALAAIEAALAPGA